MKFSEIKKFTGHTAEEAVQYLVLMTAGIRDLFAGLKFLDFGDNFQSFIWKGSIDPLTELSILHNLKLIPRYWIIADAGGSPDLIRGVAPWTAKRVSIYNSNATLTFIGTIIFFR